MEYQVSILDMNRNAAGVVIQILWSAKNEVASTLVMQTYLPEIETNDPDFIPFAQVSKEKAKEWIERMFDVSTLLEQRANNLAITSGLPWSEEVQL